MSNWIDYELDVLASNPAEINQIAARLQQPSAELTKWAAAGFGQTISEVTEPLKEVVGFEVVCNLGHLDPSVNKARRFRNSSKDKYRGIVESHLSECTVTFPAAIFLLTYCDMQYSYSGKYVIRAGEIVQRIHDGRQKAQGMEWALLDIFAPFRAEWDADLEFGSLWGEWLADVITAAKVLKAEEI